MALLDGPLDDLRRDVAHRLLRAALTTARHESGFTREEAARQLGWSVTRLMKVEQSMHPICQEELSELLAVYHLDSEDIAKFRRLSRFAEDEPVEDEQLVG